MALRSVFDPPGIGGSDDLLCSGRSCQVCGLWPRIGEERADWLARLAVGLHRRGLRTSPDE